MVSAVPYTQELEFIYTLCYSQGKMTATYKNTDSRSTKHGHQTKRGFMSRGLGNLTKKHTRYGQKKHSSQATGNEEKTAVKT